MRGQQSGLDRERGGGVRQRTLALCSAMVW